MLNAHTCVRIAIANASQTECRTEENKETFAFISQLMSVSVYALG